MFREPDLRTARGGACKDPLGSVPRTASKGPTGLTDEGTSW